METPAFVEYIPETPKKIQKNLPDARIIANNLQTNDLQFQTAAGAPDSFLIYGILDAGGSE